MKKGLSIGTLADTLEFRHEHRRDFIASTKAIRLYWDTDKVTMKIVGPFVILLDVTQHGLHQMATHCKIPFTLVTSILEEGTVLEKEAIVNLINTRLHAVPTQRLIRVVRDIFAPEKMIAFLSDRYLRIDNWPLFEAILPIIQGNPNIKVVSTHLDDTHFHMKIINTDVTAQIGTEKVTDKHGKNVGDIIQSGLLISNSEVGLGSVTLRPFVMRLVCTNGMVSTFEFGKMRKMHIGPVITDEDKNDNEVFLANIAENVKNLLADTSIIKKLASQFEAAKKFLVTGDRAMMWESLKNMGLTAPETVAMAPKMVNNKFDLVNVITEYAGTSRKVTVARGIELEIIAGRILNMTKTEWVKIANLKELSI